MEHNNGCSIMGSIEDENSEEHLPAFVTHKVKPGKGATKQQQKLRRINLGLKKPASRFRATGPRKPPASRTESVMGPPPGGGEHPYMAENLDEVVGSVKEETLNAESDAQDEAVTPELGQQRMEAWSKFPDRLKRALLL